MLQKLLGTAILAVALSATPAYGQLPGLDFEPYLGVYVPTQDIVDQSLPVLGDVKAGQKSGLALGGRLTAWLVGPLGFEVNGAYNFSDAQVDDGTTVADTSAAVWVADGRVILKLLPGPIGIHVNGGVAIVGLTGDAYDEVTSGTTNLGGVAGAGLRFKLPGIFAIRGDADVYFYKVSLEGEDLPAAGTDSQWQVDLIVSAGLIISII